MNNIFDFDARKGSMLDQISGGVLTPTNVSFRDGDIGISSLFDTTTSKIKASAAINTAMTDVFDTGATAFAYIRPFSDGGASSAQVIGKRNVQGWSMNLTGESGGFMKLSLFKDFDVLLGKWDLSTASIPINQWSFVAIVYNSSSVSNDPTFYINNNKYTVGSGITESSIPSGSPETDAADELIIGNRTDNAVYFDGEIQRGSIINSMLNDYAMGKLYEDFLHTFPLAETKRNFYYPKPTDLSNEVEDTVGDELVINGDFDVDTTGWTATNSTLAVDTDVPYGSGNSMKITVTTGTGDAYQEINTGIGGKYILSFYIKNIDASTVSAQVWEGGGYSVKLAEISSLESETAWTKKTLEFTATTTTTRIRLTRTTSSGESLLLDNISVTQRTGLVASYNMIPSEGGVLVDTSGNGNNATIKDSVSYEEGMIFDNGNASCTIPTDLGASIDASGEATITTTFFTDSSVANKGVVSLGASSGLGGNGMAIILDTSNRVTFEIHGSAGGRQRYTASPVLIGGVDCTATMIYNQADLTLKGYVNGVLEVDQSIVDPVTIPATTSYIGNIGSASAFYTKGGIKNVSIYNRSFSIQEAKDYHNEYASQVYFRDTLVYEKADGTNIVPNDWSAGTGSYKVGELTTQDSVLKDLDIGIKYLENTSAGTMNFVGKQAYGEWEFGIYTPGGSTTFLYHMITADSEATNNGRYYVRIDAAGSFELKRDASTFIFAYIGAFDLNTLPAFGY